MDETYIKVAGKDRYLYRTVDKYGDTVDFLLTKRKMKSSSIKPSLIIRIRGLSTLIKVVLILLLLSI